jgi:hypothetical protein
MDVFGLLDKIYYGVSDIHPSVIIASSAHENIPKNPDPALFEAGAREYANFRMRNGCMRSEVPMVRVVIGACAALSDVDGAMIKVYSLHTS